MLFRFLATVIVVLVSLLSVACGRNTTKPVTLHMPLPTMSYEVAECASLVAVGDIMLGGTATPTLHEFGYDYPFAATARILQAADVAVGNLETALSHRGVAFDKKYTFRNPPEKVAPALKKAGFDLLSLANNHTMDYGIVALEDTLNALASVGLPAVGAGMNQAQARQAKIIEVKGQKIGFLAYSLTFPEEFWALKDRPGTAFGHASQVKQDVSALKAGVDHVVVQFHWGREGKTELRDYQVALGRASIDAGASLVLGHHPHILQAIEHYKGGVIYYSLGNFAFGSFSNRVQVGGIASVELCPSANKNKYAIKFVDVNNFRVRFRPTPIKGDKLEAAYNELKDLSALRGTRLNLVSGQAVVAVPEPF